MHQSPINRIMYGFSNVFGERAELRQYENQKTYLYNQSDSIIKPPKRMSLSLTPLAIEKMVKQVEDDMIVQLINVKKMKTTSRISCDISDGIYKIKAFITDSSLTGNLNNAFVCVTSYGLLAQDQKHQKPMGIVVNECFVLDEYDAILGDPADYLKNKAAGEGQPQPIIDQSRLKSNESKVVTLEPVQKEQNKVQPSSQLSEVEIRIQTPTKPLMKVGEKQFKNDGYEMISQLYTDFPNWKILVRLTKKNYREFISKSGMGKLTKVLNVDLVDSSGMKITGALFGEAAKEFHDALKEGEVYEVSKGQIKEDQYSLNKGKNNCGYSIMLNRQSQFVHCKNSEEFPQQQNNLKNLQFVADNRKIGQEYDIVGIITAIYDEIQIPKQNRTLHKQAIQIWDPINSITMQIVIWNRHFNVDEKLLNKTVSLLAFKLKEYNQKLSLNSTYQSQMKVLSNHEYSQYQGRKMDKTQVQSLSERKNRNGVVEIEENLKNLKELESEVAYIEDNKQIKSTLTLTVSMITYKNWCYESCPFCRRSAEAGNRCQSCDKYVEETIPRFKLNVELSDYCGSIWATGFQEFGNKLFSGYLNGIKGIKMLDQVQRHRLFERYQYQQFTMKIVSKLDRDRQVKHTVNRIYESNLLQKIQENIQRINNIK